MSGPIIRKYGFANFEKIFGERELQHGVTSETPADKSNEPRSPETKPEPTKAVEPPAKP